MIDQVTPRLVELTYDAALKSFWRKGALRKFLRSCSIAESFLATWAAEESKREFLDRLFPQLQQTDRGRQLLPKMARFLAEQDSFPDLQGWEDSSEKIRQAHESVGRLRRYLKDQEEEVQSRTERDEVKKRHQARQAAASKSRQDMDKLNARLAELSKSLGHSKAGYAFQDWFCDLLDFCEVVNRRPYKHGGREIDGSLTCADTTYLVELKFTGEQADVTDVDSFLKKVNDKADNTMGVMVSISGYSSVAKQGASFPKSPLLLLDSGHLFLVLYGTMRFEDVISRVRRHASQTCEAYLSAEKFSS